MSFQCLTLESSLYYAATWLKLSLLDPSVSYSDDTILFPGSQCLGTGMTPFAVQFTFKN
ncbi:hypothetical protein INQ25_05115 [Wolbachia endosymbiont of Rhagoletis cerasi]|uniref:hypothetical protein n=1 Tax=Wolbachia endosymbiont of Rhagoletis cerasi TaxID=225363 RepID=UPI001BD2CC6C|nr:hypothetical protein [Wolbachia endosymbiont of Rhagoletis cerasi]MBS9530746.1 hypothetical protein [Wolbachia endosymbiont of Rhagoletis cerasi]